MRIAILGKMGSGKTTCADYLVEHYGFTKVSMATPVKEISMVQERPEDEWAGALYDWSTILLPDPVYDYELASGGNLRDDLVWAWLQDLRKSQSRRELLQRIGTDSGRAVNPSIWTNYFRRFLPDGDLVVDDVRFLNEASALRDLGFVLVKLELGEEIRQERLMTRDGFFVAATQAHASEMEIDDIEPDHIVPNNLGPRMLERNLVSLMEEIKGTLYVA